MKYALVAFVMATWTPGTVKPPEGKLLMEFADMPACERMKKMFEDVGPVYLKLTGPCAGVAQPIFQCSEMRPLN